MRDRQPTKPGRVLLTPENGEAPFYATMEMADEPTDFGTPPTKANLLTDEAEIALFGTTADRTVDATFKAIGFRFKMLADGMATLTVTVKDTGGIPAKDVLVGGMFGETGEAIYTNDSGIATGYVSEGSVKLSITGYADIEDASDTFTAVAGGTYTRTITVKRRTYLKLTISKSFRYSGNVATVDVALGGGGAGGQSGRGEYSDAAGSARHATGGNGGGAGAVAEQTGIVPSANTVYNAVIGAGGTVGAVGGASSFMGVSATGGKVSGGGKGAKYQLATTPLTASTSGADGTGYLYASMTETFQYGGAGGGGGASNGDVRYANYESGTDHGSPGGSPGGGKGGDGYQYATGNLDGSPGTDGLGGGGGGGSSRWIYGGANYDSRCGNWLGGKGGSGCITIRIHLKEARL